jgi:alpha,alpha-trehalase
MFFDYDVARGVQLDYVSATTFYPMWAGLTTELQEKRLVEQGLPPLEMAGGIAGSTEESRGPVGPDRPPGQWDYPFGWAPHQMLIWQALMNSGRGPTAERLIYRWLYTLTLNAVNYNGTIPEKFDVVNRTHQVFAEYGNVGTKFSYITKEGFGWTNASYQVGLSMLPLHFREALNSLIPPEWIFATP